MIGEYGDAEPGIWARVYLHARKLIHSVIASICGFCSHKCMFPSATKPLVLKTARLKVQIMDLYHGPSTPRCSPLFWYSLIFSLSSVQQSSDCMFHNYRDGFSTRYGIHESAPTLQSCRRYCGIWIYQAHSDLSRPC